MIPPHVTTLSQLVLWLADTYHGGRLYHVAKALIELCLTGRGWVRE